jgi:phenylpropionate dioxygenase-like ring-hydroxylating dioxygenase large terminal subunit
MLDTDTAVEKPRSVYKELRRWPELETELAAGLRNHWYVVMRSNAVPADRPVAVRRMGEDLVAWRDGEGKVRLMADRCAHRGARLSLGRVREGALMCWYHGWVYDGTGQCQSIPSEGGACPLATEVKIKSYPTQEHGGLVFAYFSSDGRAPHEPCPNPYELEDRQWNGFIVTHHWQGVNWFRAMDNLADPLHGPFLHAGTYTLGRTKGHQDRIETRQNEDGSFYIGRKSQALVNFDFTEYHFPNWFRLDIPYPWSAGPGGPMRILVFVCPIDAQACQVYMVRKRKIGGWKFAIWWTLWHLRLERKMWDVLDQDELILASQRGSEALGSEYLTQGDSGITLVRKLFRDAVAKEKRSA